VRHVLEERLDRVHEGITARLVAEARPPDRDPPARSKCAAERHEPGRLVDPVERGGSHPKVERVCLQLRVLERVLHELDLVAQPLAEEFREPRVRFDRDHLGAGLEQAPRHVAGPRPNLDHVRSRPQSTALAENLVDLLRVPGTRRVVHAGVETEDPAALATVEYRPLCDRRPRLRVVQLATSDDTVIAERSDQSLHLDAGPESASADSGPRRIPKGGRCAAAA
jgi:hypothetical protein